jgi:hypothetical protein
MKKALRDSPSGVGMKSSSKSVIPNCEGRGTLVRASGGKFRGYMISLLLVSQSRYRLSFVRKHDRGLAVVNSTLDHGAYTLQL